MYGAVQLKDVLDFGLSVWPIIAGPDPVRITVQTSRG